MSEECETCKKVQDDDVGGEIWIECTNCNKWWHSVCAEVEKVPEEDEPWYCKPCANLRLRKGKRDGSRFGSCDNFENNDDVDNKRLQLQLMTSLIKEKEELCALKQNQLNLMESLSSKNKDKSVENWVDKHGEHSRHVKDNEKPQLSDRNNARKNVTIRKSTKISQATGGKLNCSTVDGNDVSSLMKKQMQLISQQYLADLPEFDGDAISYLKTYCVNGFVSNEIRTMN